MDLKLKKQAAVVIRRLAEENADMQNKLEHIKMATSLLFKLYKQGSVSAENLDSFYEELINKSQNDLSVLEKVSELQFSPEFTLGSLSDRLQDDGTLDSFTRFLLED